MKKWLLSMVVLVACMLMLTGCGKSEIFISVAGLDRYEMTEIPTNVVNFSHDEDGITVTVKEDGDYTFGIKDGDGNEYTFTLKYYDKTAEVETDADIDVSASIR